MPPMGAPADTHGTLPLHSSRLEDAAPRPKAPSLLSSPRLEHGKVYDAGAILPTPIRPMTPLPSPGLSGRLPSASRS